MRLPHIRALAVVLALVVLPAVGLVWLRHSLETTPPIVRPPDLLSAFFDTTPVTVVFTFEGEHVLRHTTAHDIRSNPTLWRHMRLAEWNTVPDPLRREGLDRMLARYRGILMNPRVWDGMDAGDWDLVPQPMRTLRPVDQSRASNWRRVQEVEDVIVRGVLEHQACNEKILPSHGRALFRADVLSTDLPRARRL